MPLPDPFVSDPQNQRNFDALTPGGGLLLLEFGDRSIAVGSEVVEWPGADDLSDVSTVAHGLGEEPTVVVITPNDQTGTGPIAGYTQNHDETNFEIRLSTLAGFTPASSATTTVSWIAIT